MAVLVGLVSHSSRRCRRGGGEEVASRGVLRLCARSSATQNVSSSSQDHDEVKEKSKKKAKEGGSLEVMRKFSEQYAKRSNTRFCVDKVRRWSLSISACVPRGNM